AAAAGAGRLGRDPLAGRGDDRPHRGDVLGVPGAATGLVGGGRARESGTGGRVDHRAAALPLGRVDARGRGGRMATTSVRAGGGARRARSGDAPRRRPPDRTPPRRLLVALGAGPT